MRKTIITCDGCGNEKHGQVSTVQITIDGLTVARTAPQAEDYDLCGRCQVLIVESIPYPLTGAKGVNAVRQFIYDQETGEKLNGKRGFHERVLDYIYGQGVDWKRMMEDNAAPPWPLERHTLAMRVEPGAVIKVEPQVLVDWDYYSIENFKIHVAKKVDGWYFRKVHSPVDDVGPFDTEELAIVEAMNYDKHLIATNQRGQRQAFWRPLENFSDRFGRKIGDGWGNQATDRPVQSSDGVTGPVSWDDRSSPPDGMKE